MGEKPLIAKCYGFLKLYTGFFFVLEQSKSGLGRVIVEVSGSHTDTHTHTHIHARARGKLI